MTSRNDTPASLHAEISRLRQQVAELEQTQAALHAQLAVTETALRDREALLGLVVKHNPNALAVFDQEMRYLLVSDRFVADYNIADQTIIGRSHYEVFPDMPERWKAVHQRSLAGAVEQATEDAFVREDGTTTFNRWECRPWYTGHGAIGGMLIFSEVTTSYKRLEEEMRRNQLLLQHILTHAPAMIYLKDLQGRYLLANRTFEQLFQLTQEQIIGKTDYDLFPPEVAHQNQTNDQMVVITGHSIENEEVLPVDGGMRTYISAKFALRTEAGDIYATGGVSTDITDRKRAEQDLRTFQILVENAPDAIGVANFAGTVTYANPAFRAMYGYGEETVGMHVRHTSAPEAQVSVEAGMQVVMQQGIWRGESINLRRDGTRFPVQSSVFLIRDGHGIPQAIATINRDISEQKRVEAERTALHQQVIDAQQAALRELSTPLIPIADDIVIMPLIGTIDSGRAQMVLETLLDGIAYHHAHIVILDVTGVTLVDTQVAQALVRAARAVKLLGAQIVLTGIQPQIAQTLIHLGADLSDIRTQSTLQRGMSYALRERNRH